MFGNPLSRGFAAAVDAQTTSCRVGGESGGGVGD